MAKLEQRQEQEKSKAVKRVVEVFPELEKGINLLEKPENIPVLQALTAREVEAKEAEAVWIDVKNQSSTYALSSYSKKAMEKVKIGRAFTVFQHQNMIQRLEQFIDSETSLIVLPAFSYLYIEGGENRWSSRELFEESLEKVRRISEEHDLKVLITVEEENSEMCFKVEALADKHLKATRTPRGVKYSSNDFETLFYDEGTGFQTTISYWSSREVEV